MLKKTITYKNLFSDEEVTEDFYFHLSKADLIEMEVENHTATYTSPKTGEKFTGMRAHLQKIMDSEDGPSVMREFKTLMRRSYVKRVGDRPVKSIEAWEEFASSEAYSELIFELLTVPEATAAFFAGMVPGNFNEQMAAVAKEVEARQKAATETPAETPALAKAEAALEARESTATEDDPTGLTNSVTPRVITHAEMIEMDSDDLKSGLATGRYKIS